MQQGNLYQTAWRGISYWMTEFSMRRRGWERMRADSGMDMYLQKYAGCRDAYVDALDFLHGKVLNAPYAQQAQLLEDYCAALVTEPNACEGHYDKGKAQENKQVVYFLAQEIAALRERFGLQACLAEE